MIHQEVSYKAMGFRTACVKEPAGANQPGVWLLGGKQ